MFEVVKMVECGRRIMPIFLGISPEDLSNEVKMAKWKSKWEVSARSNGKIDPTRWESILRSLRPLNGLVYNDAIGVVKFREEIVKEVCKIVQPFHVWDDSHVQGRSRMSEVIGGIISETPMSEKGVRVVGLYGVGGIGKTTACKCFCKEHFLEFDGRVCHIEFGDGTSEVDRVREVLKRLTNTNNEFLKDRKLDECWSRLKSLLRSNKVVLAIDNVSSCRKICDEVQKYLSLELGQGSIMMITARALGELKNLGIETSNCLSMPELVEDEARALFLNHAKPKSVVDERIVMECVNRCYFGKGDGNGSKHYHPLALKVLGSQLVGISPSKWKSQLRKEDVFNQLQEQDHPMFSILRRSFDSLGNEQKMLFIDVALFNDGGFLIRIGGVYNYDFAGGFFKDVRLSWCTIFEWLSIVHGISVDELKERLNVLKKRALLEELGDGRGKIGMHDLWREFAIMKAKRSEEEKLQWVYEEHVSSGLGRAQSCMSSGGWKKLCRIFIQESRLRSINLSKCLNVTVLKLENVYIENGALDLGHLKSIKSLEISYYKRWDSTLSDEEDQQHIIVSGIGQLLNLAVLIWISKDAKSMNAVEEISCLTNLQILYLLSCYDSYHESSLSLDLQQLRYLQYVRVEISSMVSISGFNSRMKGLRILDLTGCHHLRRCTGVGDVDCLEVLVLHGCGSLEELPNLQKLIRLQILNINDCGLLKALLGLGSLVALRVLSGLDACSLMKELPSVSNLAKLEVLDFRRCYELKCIPGLGDLVALREFRVFCHCLHGLPELRNLTKLQKVEIYGGNGDDCRPGCRVSGNVLNLAMFESVPILKIYWLDHELSNLSKLTALKSLELDFCNFERLPHMGSDMILESFTIRDCKRLRGWDGVRGLGTGPDSQVDTSSDWTLPHLREILVLNCKSLELVDLRHFPQLRRLLLYVWGPCGSMSTKPVVQCHAIHLYLETLAIEFSDIRELPDLGNFPSLQSIEILYCRNLTNLAISKPLLTLSNFKLVECRNLRTVPNIDLFPRLARFEFWHCGVELNEHEVQKLIARGFRGFHIWELKAVPSRDVVLSPASGVNWQAEVGAPNDLAAGPSLFEPCTSEFIPYNESLSEFGKISVPKRASELGSNSGGDQEQTKKLKNMK